MKIRSASIFLIVLFACVFSEETTTTETTTSLQTDITTETTVTSTTQQPDTTTDSPSTTTNSPTTSSQTTIVTTTSKQTTTSFPDTTSSSLTTVSPVPTTPKPPTPDDGSWNVTDGNLTCIRADLKVRFTISVKDHLEYIVLSPNATSSGDCFLSNITQELKLEESEYRLIMIFEKDSENAYLKNVTFSYTLPDSTDTVYNNTKLFSVKLGNSYMCDSTSNINLENVTMEIFHIRIQSFGIVGNKDFSIAEECTADNQVNDMVPIAVGIALLCLVVVVLIAYFVGRRRSRQKGYQSV